MRANYLTHISLYEDQRARDCCSEERNRGEAFVCLSVFSFVPPRAALKVFVLLSKERICCVLGKNPRFCQGTRFLFSRCLYRSRVFRFRFHARLERERAMRVLLFFSSLGFRFSLILFILLSFFSS